MKSKQFEKIKLSNGISIFHLPDDSVEWGDVRILLPLGHAHNTRGILRGSFHFLEHMVCDSSELNPGLQQFRQWVGLQGGYARAATADQSTFYQVRINHTLLEKAWKGLFSNVFNPLLREEDVVRQRSIIANERDITNFWWPASGALEYSFRTKWMKKTFIPLRQCFGSNDDLDAITSEYLKSIHVQYFTPDIKVIVAGKYDLPMIIRDLESMQLVSRGEALQTKLPAIAWKDRYATLIEEKASNFYAIGGFTPGVIPYKELSALRIIGYFFSDSYQGPLYQWLRNENPWVYNVSFNSTQWSNFQWYIKLAFSKKEQLEVAKAGIHEKLMTSIRNEKSIATQVNMELNDVSRSNEIDTVLTNATFMLPRYGYIPTDEDWKEAVTSCLDQEYLLSLYEKHFSPTVTGECTMLMKAAQ
jgi:predicted Zn-dependent peptidase